MAGQTRLGQPAPDGRGTMRETLLAVWKMSGQRPSLFDFPDCPPEFADSVSNFCELRNAGGITYTEIDCYQRLTGERVDAKLVKSIESVTNMARNGATDAQILAAFGYEGA